MYMLQRKGLKINITVTNRELVYRLRPPDPAILCAGAAGAVPDCPAGGSSGMFAI